MYPKRLHIVIVRFGPCCAKRAADLNTTFRSVRVWSAALYRTLGCKSTALGKNIKNHGGQKSKQLVNRASVFVWVKSLCVCTFVRTYRPQYYVSVLACAVRDLLKDFRLEEHCREKKH